MKKIMMLFFLIISVACYAFTESTELNISGNYVHINKNTNYITYMSLLPDKTFYEHFIYSSEEGIPSITFYSGKYEINENKMLVFYFDDTFQFIDEYKIQSNSLSIIEKGSSLDPKSLSILEQGEIIKVNDEALLLLQKIIIPSKNEENDYLAKFVRINF